MPEAIESREFRRHAQRNGYHYNGLRVYKEWTIALRDYGLPGFRLRSSVGAIESLVGMFQGVAEQVKSGTPGKLAKDLPGVEASDGNFEFTTTLDGPIYCLSLQEANYVTSTIATMAKNFGWRVQQVEGSATYLPVKENMFTEDPVTAMSRAVMVSAAAHLTSSIECLVGMGSDTELANSYAQMERSGIKQTIGNAADAYLDNTGASAAVAWQGAGAGFQIQQVLEGTVVDSSVYLAPTGITVRPGAYVQDSTGLYPTRIDVSISLVNPYGRFQVAVKNN